MVNATVRELQRKNDAAWEALGGTLEGMEAYLELTDAPGEWTARDSTGALVAQSRQLALLP